MVKHTQTIRRLLPTNCLSVLDHFVGLALKSLLSNKYNNTFSASFSDSILIPLSNLKKRKTDMVTQSVFTCSKLTIETIKQGLKYVPS